MQISQHIVVALSALLILTLAALPYLVCVVRRRATESGFAAGLAQHEADHAIRIAALNADVDALAKERLDEQRTHARLSEQRLALIAELEARIMSYTGLAVSRADYEHLKNAAETLRLARNTWQKLQGAEPWCKRAYDECQGILGLASRVHSELRKAPAIAATVKECTHA